MNSLASNAICLRQPERVGASMIELCFTRPLMQSGNPEPGSLYHGVGIEDLFATLLFIII